MPTFIDESGDPGPGPRSTPFYRVAAVWFESGGTVQDYLDGVARLRGEMNVAQDFEFHFARISDIEKKEFFHAVAGHQFHCVICSFEKRTYAPNSLTKGKIQDTVLDSLIGNLSELYTVAETQKEGNAGLNERIIYDQCDDHKYIKSLKDKFRSLPSGRGKKLIGDVKSGKSKVDACIQLADMVCGAVGRYLSGDSELYRLFKRREIKIDVIKGSNGNGRVGP